MKKWETRLRREDLNLMYAHAVRQFPDECCGLVLGKIGDPSKNETRPGTNIQRQLKEKYPDLYKRGADTGYFFDPKELMAAFNEASMKNLDVTGFYHSHPNHDAYWSREDHRAAMWAGTDEPSFPEAFHVVISIYDSVVKGACMFTWDSAEKRFVKSVIE